MKSVVIVSTADLYYGNTAAVARMNLYARALALADVDVFLLSTDALDKKKEWLEVEPHIFTLPKDGKKTGKGYNLFYVLGLVRQIKKRVKAIKGDVALLNYPSTRSLLQDILLLLFCGRFSVFCEVNEVRRFASGSTGSMRDRFFCHILEKTYKYYKGVVFISRNIQEYYASKVKKSIIVPILSDCDWPLIYSKGLDTLDMVFVGTVSYAKENLEELFEGFLLFSKDHPDARLHLYGTIGDSDKKKLEEFVARTNTVETIRYHGAISHDKVREVLSSAGVLVLPRTNNKQNYYGFSTKLSEYTVSGAPIIMTDTGVVADYFKDQENCLMCDGYDRESFRKKFEELSRMSHTEKQTIVENAYMVAKNWFDYRMYSNRLSGALLEE